jgi:hypothetical protein
MASALIMEDEEKEGTTKLYQAFLFAMNIACN